MQKQTMTLNSFLKSVPIMHLATPNAQNLQTGNYCQQGHALYSNLKSEIYHYE